MIKRLSSEDLDNLMVVETECFSDAYKKETYEYEIDDNPCAYIYGYYIEDKLVAFIDFWVTFETVQLCKIGVRKDYRRQHIGQELMDFMYDFCLKENCETILLEVRSKNDRARNFYCNEGFYELNIRKKYYSNPLDDAIVMGKILIGEEDEQ